MTRLIDADALINTLNEENIPVDVRVNYEIMNAPTIEPNGDLISRQDAIAYFFRPYSNEELYSNIDIEKALNALPSAEQVTGKLNNPDDSLLTGGSDACKEQKSKLDTISREMALAEFRDGRDVYDIMESIEELPPAETPTVLEKHQLSEETPTNTSTDLISRQDAISEIHKYFVEEIDKTPTEIDEDGDELYADMPTVNSLLACNKELSKRIKSLPSAPDSRQRGEWIFKPKDAIELMFTKPKCSKCGFESADGGNFCSNCGADMRGEDE